MYFVSSTLILFGVLAMRWNVVIGGQLFSKSLRGFTTYKMELAGQEGWVMGLALILLPFLILGILLKYFLPLKHVFTSHKEEPSGAATI
jgi:predicted membrane protein